MISADHDFLSQFKDPILLLKFVAVFLFLFLLFNTLTLQQDVFSIIIAFVTFFAILLLFFPPKIETHTEFILILLFVIIFGTLIRLLMAYYYFGNYDMESYTIVSDIFLKGLNTYNETTRYNYSPIWFNILGPLRILSNNFSIPFHFAVRGFLTTVDFFTLLLLLAIGNLEGLSKTGLIRLSLLFYLNPISYLLTGYHGQFENLALFFVLFGLFIFLKYKDRKPIAKYLSWLSLSVGLIVKHDMLIMVLSGIVNLFKKAKYIAICFLITVGLFLLTFIFYWATGSQGIISNVFLYSSIGGYYGITSFIKLPYLKYLFIAGMLIYPFLIKDREIGEQFLLGTLFFITFTTGIGIQYFVLPVVFGALRPSPWFLLYTFITSIMILGSSVNLSLYGFNVFSWNAVWICALFWFVFTHFKSNRQTANHSPVEY